VVVSATSHRDTNAGFGADGAPRGSGNLCFEIDSIEMRAERVEEFPP